MMLGCAPRTGWQRTDVRACEPRTPARVCVGDDPDRRIEVDVGGVTILPGECAQAPERGGLVRVQTTVDQTRRQRWVRAPRGRVTTLERADDTRTRCRS